MRTLLMDVDGSIQIPRSFFNTTYCTKIIMVQIHRLALSIYQHTVEQDDTTCNNSRIILENATIFKLHDRLRIFFVSLFHILLLLDHTALSREALQLYE
jgi:hypothetical protein